MDSNYVFLCGVMWCAYGQREAGNELLRAATCADPDVRSLAWALLVRGMRDLKKTILGTPGVQTVDSVNVDESTVVI